MHFIRTPSIVYNAVDDQYLALDASSGVMHVLNGTAGWLLSICEKPLTLEQTVQRAAENFDVPVEVDLTTEISTCLEELSHKGLITIIPPADACL